MTRRALGGSGGVNANDRLGVSRVLEFDAKPGTTRLTCADRIVRGAAHGRWNNRRAPEGARRSGLGCTQPAMRTVTGLVRPSTLPLASSARSVTR